MSEKSDGPAHHESPGPNHSKAQWRITVLIRYA